MKLLKRLAICISVLAITAFLLNVPVTTRQGINGKITVKLIPLYVKTCGFLYRDYQYKALSSRITNNIEDDTGKIIAIYNWTVMNIKEPPKGFKIVDNHIWNIVIRGYGTADQMADVFTTLASYVGYEAFWKDTYADKTPGRLILSFVKIKNEWYVFDILNKKSFMDEKELAAPAPYGLPYREYLSTIDERVFNKRIRRPDEQKIFPRIVYELQKLVLGKEKMQSQ